MQRAAPVATLDWTHTKLHPKVATGYFELPDMEATLASYDAAPLMRLLFDPDLVRAVEKLVPGSEGIAIEVADIEALFLDSLSEPWPLALSPLELLDSVRTLSVSYRLPPAPAPGATVAPALLAERLGLQIVVDFATNEVASEVAVNLAKEWVASQGDNLPEDFDPAVPFAAPMPEGAQLLGLGAWMVVDGGRLAIGVGNADFGHALFAARAKSEGSSFAARAEVAAAAEVLGELEGETIYRGWQMGSAPQLLLDYAPLLVPLMDDSEPIRALLDKPQSWIRYVPGLLSPLLGPTGVGAFSTTLSSRGFTRVYALTPADAAPAWYGKGPIDRGVFAFVPEKVPALWTATIDGAAMGSALRTMLASLPADGSATLAALEQELAIDLGADLFGQLGPDMALFVAPLAGIAPPNLLLSVRVADEAMVADRLGRVLQALARAHPGSLTSTERPYRRMPYFELSVLDIEVGDDPVELFAAMGLVSGRLIVGLAVGQAGVAVKREMRRLVDRAEAATSGAPVEPAFDPASLRIGQLDSSVWMLDWPGVVDSLYGTLKALTGLAGGFVPEDLPIDLAALPEADLFVRHLVPTVVTTQRIGKFVRRHARTSFGPELPVVLSLAAAGVDRAMQTPAPVDSMEITGESSDTTGSDTTQRALLRVRTGINVWSAFHDGAHPATLTRLTEPSDILPTGVFNGEPLPTDGWGNALHYLRAEGSYSLWSAGPNGIDESGQGDDVRL